MTIKFISKTFLMTVLILCTLLFSTTETTFAGDPNCQSGYISSPYINNPPPRRPGDDNREQRKFAAAQAKNSHNQSPPNGFGGNGSGANSGFSYLSSLLLFIGGLWAAIVLLRQRFKSSIQNHKSKTRRFLSFGFKPSFALSVFGMLFISIIAVNLLTANNKVTAEKRDKLNKLKMTGISNPSNKPVFISAQEIGGNESTQIGAPVFDAAGNRYVRGTFTRNLPIGEQTLQESKFFDLFIAKYSSDGTALWARQGIGATTEVTVPGTAIEGATALAVDLEGNLYVGGSFVKTLTLQGGSNPSVTLTDDNEPGLNYESFVAKYDTNGNLLWARGGDSGSPKNADNLEIGQNAIDQIVLDQNGNPYLTGFVSGSRFFGSKIPNNGQSDILLAKIDPVNGAIVWQQVIGGTNDDNGLDLKIDSANNLYLIGNYGSPIITFPNGDTFGNPDDPTDSLDASTNTFIAKFDGGGKILWAENLDNDDSLGGSQITVNPAGEIFLTGYYFDSATFGSTVLTETEGSGDDEEALGGYVTKLDTDGNFLWAQGFGGVGKAIALDPSGRVYVVGTFWDGGRFGSGTGNEETLASFGGTDLFVARYDSNGGFDWAKPITGSGFEGGVDISNPSDENGRSENEYNPLGIAYNPARGTMFVSGDFSGVLTLDCLTLKTPDAQSRHSYLAELNADNAPTSCRIWNGLDEDDNNWDSPDNWNGNIVPSNFNSIYVPYTGNSFDNPTFNPAGARLINNLTIGDDRTLTLVYDLPMVGKLWLIGGFIDTEDRLIDLTDTATANRVADADENGGYVIGKLRKEFGDTNPFVFPVGSANGYSPVEVNPQEAIGTLLAIKAVEQPQPLFSNSPNRINRYWTINRAGKGFITANLTFHYLQADVFGDESLFKVFKIEENFPLQQTATIDTAENTATVSNVSEFSDWTLAQVSPTSAQVEIGGRVINANGNGIARAVVSLIDGQGNTQTAYTNAFGYYRFSRISTGATYVLSVDHKRYNFMQQTQTYNIFESRSDLDFIAISQ